MIAIQASQSPSGCCSPGSAAAVIGLKVAGSSRLSSPQNVPPQTAKSAAPSCGCPSADQALPVPVTNSMTVSTASHLLDLLNGHLVVPGFEGLTSG